MDTRELTIRQGDKVTLAGRPDGVHLSPGLDHETGHRISQGESNITSPVKPKRRGAKAYRRGVQRTSIRILPLRKEREEGRDGDNANCSEACNSSGTVGSNTDGKPRSQEGVQSDPEGKTAPGKSPNQQRGDEGSKDANEPPAKWCFLNSSRYCSEECMAFEASKTNNCKILVGITGINRLLVNLRKSEPSPVATVAPKVNI